MPASCTPSPFDPLCLGQVVIGQGGKAVIGGALDKFANEVAESVESILKANGTFWLKVPSPTGLGLSSTITTMQDWLGPITATIAVIGVIIALTYMGWTGQLRAGGEAAAMIVKLIAVAGAGTLGVAILIASGDAFSPWIIEQATGQPFSSQASTVVTKQMLLGNGVGATLLVGQALYLASALQIVFMIIRSALLIVMMVVWPTVAAATATEAGRTWFKRLNGYILAWLLYKPVAAVIYATGFLVVKDPVIVEGASEGANALMALLMGATVILLAALSLPALIRFVAPIAAPGVSSAFSGAAAIGGAATGALALTGIGAAAAGAGGAAAATGAATAPPTQMVTEPATGGGGATPQGGGGGGGGGPVPSGGGGPADGGGASDQGGSAGSDQPSSGGGGGESGGGQPAPPPASGGGSARGATSGPAAAAEIVQGGAKLVTQAVNEVTDDGKNDMPSGPTGA